MKTKYIVNNEKVIIKVKNSIEKSEQLGFKAIQLNWDKYVYTVCLLLTYITWGINTNLFPSAMVDIKFLFHTSMQDLNYATSIGQLGYLIGSLSGFLYKCVNRQLTFIVMLGIVSAIIAIEMMATELWQVYLCFFLWNMGGATFDSGNAVWIIEMWKDRAAPVIQLAQMNYGVGAIIGPQLTKNYIIGDLSITDIETTTALINTTLMTNILSTTTVFDETVTVDPNYAMDRRPKLRIPFLISGGITAIFPTILLLMFFVKRYKVPDIQKSDVDLIEPDSKINAQIDDKFSPGIRQLLIGLMAIFLMIYNGLETIFLTYASTYCQYLPVKISAPKAADMMSVLLTSYTVGRGVSALISSRLRADIMLCYHKLIIGIALAILYFGQNSEKVIYAGMTIIGFGFSAIWPSFFVFADMQITLSDKIASFLAVSSAIIFLLTPLVISPLIEKHPQVFLYIETAYFIGVVAIFITMLIIIKKFKRKSINYAKRG